MGELVARSGAGVGLDRRPCALFSEWPGRVVACVKRGLKLLEARAAAASVPFTPRSASSVVTSWSTDWSTCTSTS